MFEYFVGAIVFILLCLLVSYTSQQINGKR